MTDWAHSKAFALAGYRNYPQMDKVAEVLREERGNMEKLRNALTIARMAIEQGNPLTARIAANGPTIGTVIERALSSPDRTFNPQDNGK